MIIKHWEKSQKAGVCLSSFAEAPIPFISLLSNASPEGSRLVTVVLLICASSKETLLTTSIHVGINNAEIFASATLLRPYTGGDNSTSKEIRGLSSKQKAERTYEMQQKMRKGVKDILGDETKWPQELIFIGRNLRIVQGNNQFLGVFTQPYMVPCHA